MKEVDLCSLIKAARNCNLFGRYEIVFNYPAICAFLGNLDREEFIYLCGFLDELPPIDPRIVENFLISSFAQKPAQKCTTEPPAEPPADAAQVEAVEKPAEKPAEKPDPEPAQAAPAVTAEKPQAKPAPAPVQDKPAEVPARRRGRPSKNDNAPYTGPIPADFGALGNAELREFCQKAGVLGKIQKDCGGTKREQMLSWCKAHFAPADAAQAEKPAAKPAPAPEPIVDIHEVPCYDAQGADDEETEPLDGWDDDGATAVAPAPAEGAQADADDDWDL